MATNCPVLSSGTWQHFQHKEWRAFNVCVWLHLFCLNAAGIVCPTLFKKRWKNAEDCTVTSGFAFDAPAPACLFNDRIYHLHEQPKVCSLLSHCCIFSLGYIPEVKCLFCVLHELVVRQPGKQCLPAMDNLKSLSLGPELELEKIVRMVQLNMQGNSESPTKLTWKSDILQETSGANSEHKPCLQLFVAPFWRGWLLA